jgi:trimethylamine corrinoid protein
MADDAAARLFQAFVNHDPAAAITVIERARSSGTPQDQLFDRLFAPAMSMLGGAWAKGAIDEYRFTRAAVVAEQVTSFVSPPRTAPDTGLTVVIGTMQGDEHTILKNIVGSALKEAGHRVLDLGSEVRPIEFLERVEETGGRTVIVFAEMLAAATAVVRVREMFASSGRDDVVMFVAGAPFVADEKLARAVGANGVVRGAESALKLLAKAAQRSPEPEAKAQ